MIFLICEWIGNFGREISQSPLKKSLSTEQQHHTAFTHNRLERKRYNVNTLQQVQMFAVPIMTWWSYRKTYHASFVAVDEAVLEAEIVFGIILPYRVNNANLSSNIQQTCLNDSEPPQVGLRLFTPEGVVRLISASWNEAHIYGTTSPSSDIPW